ncbi:Potassium-transporting ATPase KdpC subunit [Pseudoclavibacter triregionum]|nr:Potassium-transporting ATPase KdpC subunit [Pseudoclavibacter triregionum]
MHFSPRGAAANLWTALRALLALTVILGIGYPLAIAGVGLLLPSQAGGSPVVAADGTRIGSSLIGQDFAGPEWFHGRPSAAGDDGYDAMSSGASNLSPTNPELLAAVEERRAEVAAENGVDPAEVPLDAVTASGSGLDPHISPAYARLQAARVAEARGLPADAVAQLVEARVEAPDLGFIGEPRVNVLLLNADLEQLAASLGGAK